jgi:hypothetical protein
MGHLLSRARDLSLKGKMLMALVEPRGGAGGGGLIGAATAGNVSRLEF